MRKPHQIPGLSRVQVQTFYKSFLRQLDATRDPKLNEWELKFVESNLYRTVDFSEAQGRVIENLMDKNPRVYPRFKDYSEEATARLFFFQIPPEQNPPEFFEQILD